MKSKKLIFMTLFVGFFVMFFSSSIKGVYQVYFSDLAIFFGGKKSSLAVSGALFMIVIGLSSPIVGVLCDKYGPLKTAMLGSLLAGISFITMSFSDKNIFIFTALYGIVASFSLAAMTYVSMGVLVDRLVAPEHKAFAYAVVTNGTSIGFIVLSPLWVWLQSNTPWHSVFLILGILFLIPLSIGLFYVSNKILLVNEEAKSGQNTSLRFLLKDSKFYILSLSFISCGATMAFVDIHLISYWQINQISRFVQGSSLSVLGVLELFSGLLAGWLATRMNKSRLLSFFYVIRTASVCLLLLSQTTVIVYLFAALFGVSYLGTVVLTSSFCFDFYGSEIKGRVFGLIFFIHQIGALLVTQLGAFDIDINKNYQNTILVLAVCTTFAGLISLFLPEASEGNVKIKSMS